MLERFLTVHSFSRSTIPAVACLVLAAFAAGCGSDESGELLSAALIRVEVDNADPERLVQYYLGGYLGPDGGDPFESGLVVIRKGRIYLNLDSLHQVYAPSVGALRDEDQNNRLEWEELVSFLQKTYYDARSIPPSLEDFRERFAYADSSDQWFAVEVNGVVTAARRRIHVPLEALRTALDEYWFNDAELHYPVGTAIVAEHLLDDELAETTAMVKRKDGYWDFATYDSSGNLATSTATPPRPLNSPTQCSGCHFGSKLFEPEKSFPEEARPGPHGPRVLHVDSSLRDAEVVEFFDEHARRSDTVLGLYSTLFVSRLRAERRAGTISDRDARLLENLKL